MCADRTVSDTPEAVSDDSAGGGGELEPTQAPRRWREPWIHFMVLGGVLFGLESAFTTPGLEVIRVRAGHVDELRAAISNRGEQPTSEAVQLELDRFVDSEIMVREARRLGLDRGDMIIRRRLEQKMVFLVNDMADASPPTNEEMAAWLEARRARYRAPARYDVEHVYFARERRGEAAKASASAALARWRGQGEAPEGDPFLRGAQLSRRTRRQLVRVFGETFARRVAEEGADDVRTWRGPVESPYGYHLFRVTGRVPSVDPALPEVEARVRADMLEHRRRVAAGEARAELRRQYRIEIEERP